jgi:hypothetical protein
MHNLTPVHGELYALIPHRIRRRIVMNDNEIRLSTGCQLTCLMPPCQASREPGVPAEHMGPTQGLMQISWLFPFLTSSRSRSNVPPGVNRLDGKVSPQNECRTVSQHRTIRVIQTVLMTRNIGHDRLVAQDVARLHRQHQIVVTQSSKVGRVYVLDMFYSKEPQGVIRQ